MSKSSSVVGRHPVLEALQSDTEVDKVLISKQARGETIQKIKELCQEKGIYIQSVPEEKLHREFRNLNHQGVAALISIIDYYELQELVDSVLDSGELPFFIILDGITDVRNFGAIARTAYGLGAHGIIIPNKKSASVHADAVKASAGALLNIPICKVNNTVAAIKDLKLNGINIVGVHAFTDYYITDIPGDVPLGLVMGSEDKGISKLAQKEIDNFYKVPIQSLESYNVSVAAALAMYQVKINRKTNW